MQTLIIFITVGIFAQGVLLYLCWHLWTGHRREPVHIAETSVVTALLSVRERMALIQDFTDMLMSDRYGALNEEQKDFIRSIQRECTEARHVLTELTPGDAVHASPHT